jgi:hypothetical protein
MTGSEATAANIICLLILVLIPALMGIGHGKSKGFPASVTILVSAGIITATLWIRGDLVIWIIRVFFAVIILGATVVLADALQNRKNSILD